MLIGRVRCLMYMTHKRTQEGKGAVIKLTHLNGLLYPIIRFSSSQLENSAQPRNFGLLLLAFKARLLFYYYWPIVSVSALKSYRILKLVCVRETE